MPNLFRLSWVALRPLLALTLLTAPLAGHAGPVDITFHGSWDFLGQVRSVNMRLQYDSTAPLTTNDVDVKRIQTGLLSGDIDGAAFSFDNFFLSAINDNGVLDNGTAYNRDYVQVLGTLNSGVIDLGDFGIEFGGLTYANSLEEPAVPTQYFDGSATIPGSQFWEDNFTTTFSRAVNGTNILIRTNLGFTGYIAMTGFTNNSAESSVPAPAGLLLLVFGTACVLMRRRRA